MWLACGDESKDPDLREVIGLSDVRNNAEAVTKTQEHGRADRLGVEVECHSPYVHRCIVQEIAFPLTMVRNSKELVKAIRDVLEGMILVFVHAPSF